LIFSFKLAFPELGAISVHAQFFRPVEASYCWGSPSFFRALALSTTILLFHEELTISRLREDFSK
jgi:hypothetical protein